jgi:hypothetical protein
MMKRFLQSALLLIWMFGVTGLYLAQFHSLVDPLRRLLGLGK